MNISPAMSTRATPTRPRPRCLGDYDFERIAHYARLRFIEGRDTVSLLSEARSEREREEIALVSLLDVRDDEILDLDLRCRHAQACRITDCRRRLRRLIQAQLEDSRD